MFIAAIQYINIFSFTFKLFIIKFFFLKKPLPSFPKTHGFAAWYILYASAEPQLNLKQTSVKNELNFLDSIPFFIQAKAICQNLIIDFYKILECERKNIISDYVSKSYLHTYINIYIHAY